MQKTPRSLQGGPGHPPSLPDCRSGPPVPSRGASETGRQCPAADFRGSPAPPVAFGTRRAVAARHAKSPKGRPAHAAPPAQRNVAPPSATRGGKTRERKTAPHRWQNALMSLVRPENMGQAKPDLSGLLQSYPSPPLTSPHTKKPPGGAQPPARAGAQAGSGWRPAYIPWRLAVSAGFRPLGASTPGRHPAKAPACGHRHAMRPGNACLRLPAKGLGHRRAAPAGLPHTPDRRRVPVPTMAHTPASSARFRVTTCPTFHNEAAPIPARRHQAARLDAAWTGATTEGAGSVRPVPALNTIPPAS